MKSLTILLLVALCLPAHAAPHTHTIRVHRARHYTRNRHAAHPTAIMNRPSPNPHPIEPVNASVPIVTPALVPPTTQGWHTLFNSHLPVSPRIPSRQVPHAKPPAHAQQPAKREPASIPVVPQREYHGDSTIIAPGGIVRHQLPLIYNVTPPVLPVRAEQINILEVRFPVLTDSTERL